jgi:hypothetical protein
MLLKELKESLVVAGARTRLRELEEERKALLKILDIPYTDGDRAIKVIQAARAIRDTKVSEPTRKRSGWSKERLKKFRATMKKKYGAPSEWPSSRASKGLS